MTGLRHSEDAGNKPYLITLIVLSVVIVLLGSVDTYLILGQQSDGAVTSELSSGDEPLATTDGADRRNVKPITDLTKDETISALNNM